MPPGTRHQPGELLQVASTIAAVAIALATLTAQEESLQVGWFPIDLFFLLGGLFSLLGSVFAMVELWREADLDLLDFLPLPNPDRPANLGDHDHALRFTAWGILFIGEAYGAVAVGLSYEEGGSMVNSRLQAYVPTISFAGLLLGFLIITIGGRIGAPLAVAGIGVALIVAALIVPFTSLPIRRSREEQPAATDAEEGTRRSRPTGETPQSRPQHPLTPSGERKTADPAAENKPATKTRSSPRST